MKFHNPIIHNAFGVDLGTSAVKIYCQHTGQITTEKNMIAFKDDGEVLAVGNDAFDMYEKNPPNIKVHQPVKNGRIADVTEALYVLTALMQRADRRIGYAPIIFFSAPVNMSEIEKRAYYAISQGNIIQNPKVYLVDRAICDAIALGIPIHRTRGSMIVNIGGQNPEISVLANEQVIISKDIPIGGQQLNGAICDVIRRDDNLLIGHHTAKRLKAVLSSLGEDIREERKIYGISTLSGLPKEGIVTSEQVSLAVEAQISQLAYEIRNFLERTPPQISESIRREGIYLTGGTARIPFIDRYLRHYIGVDVKLSTHYELCTVRGLEELVNHKALWRWGYTIRKKK